jgi:hypothetical protein
MTRVGANLAARLRLRYLGSDCRSVLIRLQRRRDQSLPVDPGSVRTRAELLTWSVVGLGSLFAVFPFSRYFA